MTTKNSKKDKSPIECLYMIRDIKARRYFPPYTAPNRDVAVRLFSQHMNQPNTIFQNNPSDFELFEVGDFDPSDGQIDIIAQYVNICSGHDVVGD